MCKEELGCYVGKTSCRREKQKVLRKVIRDYRVKYAKLFNYADELKGLNPVTTCFVRTDTQSEPRKVLFSRFYVCFNVTKQGIINGCGKIIGLDSFFIFSKKTL